MNPKCQELATPDNKKVKEPLQLANWGGIYSTFPAVTNIIITVKIKYQLVTFACNIAFFFPTIGVNYVSYYFLRMQLVGSYIELSGIILSEENEGVYWNVSSGCRSA